MAAVIVCGSKYAQRHAQLGGFVCHGLQGVVVALQRSKDHIVALHLLDITIYAEGGVVAVPHEVLQLTRTTLRCAQCNQTVIQIALLAF